MKSFTILSLVAIAATTVLVASAVGPLALPELESEAEPPSGAEHALSCNTPVVEAFHQLRIQALELSELASVVPAPLEDTPAAQQGGDDALADLEQRIRALDALSRQAFLPSAPLTPQERLLAQGVGVHTSRLVNLASRLGSATTDDGEFDAAYVVNGLDSISVQGWELAQLIADAAPCELTLSMQEASPYETDYACESFEPEYELAMHGSCSY